MNSKFFVALVSILFVGLFTFIGINIYQEHQSVKELEAIRQKYSPEVRSVEMQDGIDYVSIDGETVETRTVVSKTSCTARYEDWIGEFTLKSTTGPKSTVDLVIFNINSPHRKYLYPIVIDDYDFKWLCDHDEMILREVILKKHIE